MDEPTTPPANDPVQELNTLMREMDALVTTTREVIAKLPKPWKGDLASPAGWRQLQQDTYSDAITDHLSPEDIARIRRSYAAWSYRFSQLRFLTATRPVWNS